MKDEKHQDRIDVGILNQVVMVEYRDLKPVLMKASWMKHAVERQSTIKKNCMDFGRASLKNKRILW